MELVFLMNLATFKIVKCVEEILQEIIDVLSVITIMLLTQITNVYHFLEVGVSWLRMKLYVNYADLENILKMVFVQIQIIPLYLLLLC